MHGAVPSESASPGLPAVRRSEACAWAWSWAGSSNQASVTAVQSNFGALERACASHAFPGLFPASSEHCRLSSHRPPLLAGRLVALQRDPVLGPSSRWDSEKAINRKRREYPSGDGALHSAVALGWLHVGATPEKRLSRARRHPELQRRVDDDLLRVCNEGLLHGLLSG